MVTLERDALVFAFPEVHPAAVLTVDFQRTLRIPDDGRTYPLPPGLGRFPLRHVDDHAAAVPSAWQAHGGLLLPMYQAEALWVYFSSEGQDGWPPYRFAVKVATGKRNAVSGESWRDGFHRTPQDYLVAPEQPWIDGYCVRQGVIRQFVAMPLGEGYTAEEQLTGQAEHGGLQLQVFPMRREAYERRFKRRRREREECSRVMFCRMPPAHFEMGLAPGGEMAQELYADPYDLADWDLTHTGRCFVHIADALAWRAITGEAPPTQPPTAQQYAKAGLPWFDYYAADQTPLPGTAALGGLKGLGQLFGQQGKPLPDNTHLTPTPVIPLAPKAPRRPVREGAF